MPKFELFKCDNRVPLFNHNIFYRTDQFSKAAAPDTISEISVVIALCRA
jgi:hypothetical protein